MELIHRLVLGSPPVACSGANMEKLKKEEYAGRFYARQIIERLCILFEAEVAFIKRITRRTERTRGGDLYITFCQRGQPPSDRSHTRFPGVQL